MWARKNGQGSRENGVWKSDDKLWESLLSFHTVGPEGQKQSSGCCASFQSQGLLFVESTSCWRKTENKISNISDIGMKKGSNDWRIEWNRNRNLQPQFSLDQDL